MNELISTLNQTSEKQRLHLYLGVGPGDAAALGKHSLSL